MEILVFVLLPLGVYFLAMRKSIKEDGNNINEPNLVIDEEVDSQRKIEPKPSGEFTDKMMIEFYCKPHISGFKFGHIMNDILIHKKPRDHSLALGILRVAIEEFHKREETEVPDHYYNLIRGDLGLPLIEETFQPLPLWPDQSNPEQLSQMQMGIYLSKDQGFEFYKINEEIYEHIESDEARDEAFSAVIASISEYHMKGGPEGDMEEEVVYDELRKSIGLPRDKE